MTVIYPPVRPSAELDSPDADLHRRELARVARLAMRGQLNTSIFVTLDPGSATTDVIDARVSGQTCAAFCPTSASAAAELPTLWVECANGTMTIHHTNSGTTDRTYTMGIFG